jgi:hypothetical protein
MCLKMVMTITITSKDNDVEGAENYCDLLKAAFLGPLGMEMGLEDAKVEYLVLEDITPKEK